MRARGLRLGHQVTAASRQNTLAAALKEWGPAPHDPRRPLPVRPGLPPAHQTGQARCLTVLTNAVADWTTEYDQLAMRGLRATGRRVPDDVLARVSLAHSENVNFFGVITVDVETMAIRAWSSWTPT